MNRGYYFVHSKLQYAYFCIFLCKLVCFLVVVEIYRGMGGKFGVGTPPLDKFAAPGPRRTCKNVFEKL